MYMVWYILLNVILFLVFVFPVLYYSTLTMTNNPTNFSNKSLTNLNFKDLFSEYTYYNKNFNTTLSNFLLTIKVHLTVLNRLDYNPSNNYFLITNNNTIKVNKLNLNYYSNFFKLNTLNFKVLNFSSIQYKTLLVNLKSLKNSNISVNDLFETNIKQKWVTKYSPSNFIKYIKDTTLNNYTILYLRKNKVFNKGRYSRNRQYYRTGVYWCLYVNIVAVVGIYFWFYRFTMNFGYLWWLLYIFMMSFIVPKAIKYRLYNPNILLKVYVFNFVWLYSLVNNLFQKFTLIYINFTKYLIKLSLLSYNNSFLYSILNKLVLILTQFKYFNFQYYSNSSEYKILNSFLK